MSQESATVTKNLRAEAGKRRDGMSLSTFSAFKRVHAPGSTAFDAGQLRRLQAVELEIAKDVFAFCRERGLVCMLAGGSALGALRHGGFIPWDDDMDLLMPRADYERFRHEFAASFADRYWVRDAGRSADHVLGSMQIRRKGTSVVTREDLVTGNRECGAFIDVFIVENTFDNSVLRGLHGFGSLTLGFLYSCRKTFSERRFLKVWGASASDLRRTLRVKSLIGFFTAFMGVNRWVRLWNAWNAVCRKHRSDHVTVPVGRAHFFGELGLRKELCATREIAFEGMSMRCPGGLEAYLTRLYGPDYMTPPPESARERHVVFEPLKLP